MRSRERPAIRALLGGVLLLAACDTPAEPPATPKPPAAPAHRGSGPENLAIGTGEPRKAEPFTMEQRLLDAVRRGDRPTVERALAHGATVAAKDDLGRGTILLATKDAGDLELVLWLQAKGAAVDDVDVGGRTALGFAAEAGRLDLVRHLAQAGAVADRPDVQRRTPLFLATFGDHADVVAFLAERGADVNARDQFQDTPLMIACAKGHAATAALLLRRGADASLRDQEGRTARERAAEGTAPCLDAGS